MALRVGKLWRRLLWCATMPISTVIDTLHAQHMVIGLITKRAAWKARKPSDWVKHVRQQKRFF